MSHADDIQPGIQAARAEIAGKSAQQPGKAGQLGSRLPPLDVAAVLTTWRVTDDGGVDLLDPDGEVVARLLPHEAGKLCAVLERYRESDNAQLCNVFADLAAAQTRLGAEFEAVWDGNIEDLYER